jgi:hypothetical protein
LIEDIERDASFKWFGSASSSEEHKQLTLKQIASDIPNPTLARIAEVLELAIQKIELVKSQSSELEDQIRQASSSRIEQDSFVKAIEGEESMHVDSSDAPKPSEAESSGTSFQTAWEKWCNAKYGTTKKAPLDPANTDAHPSLSTSNIESAPISNLNCKSKTEIMMVIQKWQAWAKTQKMLFKDKVSWSDLALRLTWGFTGNLGIWWERVTPKSKLKILNHENQLMSL